MISHRFVEGLVMRRLLHSGLVLAGTALLTTGWKGDPAAEQKFVDKYRVGEAFERIDAHGRITPDTARTLIHWLAEGAKATP